MECRPLLYESLLSEQKHGMRTSAVRVITLLAGAWMLTSSLRVITLLAGAWNAHICSTSHSSLSRSMECPPLLYDALLSSQEHGILILIYESLLS
jgi:hypothetical protein